ncbi:hypothetical protein CJ030_MR3G022596 [Morella rubra]|uniref:Uncharacterized protein n=1 Tax=Morella rubra TaxID=262757 RepID=A0A6A1W6I7_9ROSI|nr:hypothetical protein CJ030_MR3G022596 [Morella rubra]
MSQGTPACPSSCASTSSSKCRRGRTHGVSLEKSLGSSSGFGKLSVHISEGECGGVSSTIATYHEDWNVGLRADSDLR